MFFCEETNHLWCLEGIADRCLNSLEGGRREGGEREGRREGGGREGRDEGGGGGREEGGNKE